MISSVLQQLRQCRGQQFRSASIRVGFEFVPFTITDTEALMQRQSLFNRLFWPFFRGHVGVGSAGPLYPDCCDRWWW